jgi:hypothetical protein
MLTRLGRVRPFSANDQGQATSQDRTFQIGNLIIENRPIAQIFNQAAGMADGGPVALKQVANRGQGKAEHRVAEVHGHLPRPRDIGFATGRGTQRFVRNAKHAGNAGLDLSYAGLHDALFAQTLLANDCGLPAISWWFGQSGDRRWISGCKLNDPIRHMNLLLDILGINS